MVTHVIDTGEKFALQYSKILSFLLLVSLTLQKNEKHERSPAFVKKKIQK
jgi:hypothetical protein